MFSFKRLRWDNQQTLIIVLFVFSFLVVGAINLLDGFDSDSMFYLAMSQGEMGWIPAPFRQRILQPLLSGGLSSVFGFGVGHAIVAILSFAFFARGLWLLLRSQGVRGELILAAMGGFWLPALVTEMFLPDLMGAAIFVWILVCFLRKQEWAAALLFVPLIMVRESYILAALILLVLGVRERRFKLPAMVLASAGVGYWLSGWLAGPGENTHSLSGGLYLILKMPFNAIKNMFGLPIWTNTLAEHFTIPPIWKTDLPQFLQIGNFKEIGVTAWQPQTFALNWLLFLFSFGLLSLYFLSRFRSVARFRGEQWMEWCKWVGIVSFVLAPLSGASIHRLYPYAWPLFVIVIPIAISKIFSSLPSENRLRLILVHLGLSILPIVGLWDVLSPASIWALVGGIAFVLISKNWLLATSSSPPNVDLFLDTGDPSGGSSADGIALN